MKGIATLSIGLAGCNRKEDFEIDDSEFEGMTDFQKEEHIDNYVWEMFVQGGHIETSWKEKK